ncbi:hypothetical protein ACFX15_018485 [Malus domestica]
MVFFFYSKEGNGSRPKRAAGDRYWKVTGVDKEVKSSERIALQSPFSDLALQSRLYFNRRRHFPHGPK